MFTVIPFEDRYEQVWDKFVADDAINGLFLQSRNFLNYHPKGRFIDSSCLIFDREKLVAVVPGCVINNDNKKIFSSHPGSTFGGLIIHRKYYDATNLIEMIRTLEHHLLSSGFQKSLLKITSDLFCKEKSDLLQYILTYCGYSSYCELSTYIDFDEYNPDILANFNHGQKGKLKQALKKQMCFKRLESDEEISIFYTILSKNLLKFNTKPVHSMAELIDFKNNRLKDIVDFYGVLCEDKIIAGAMLFKINLVLHTQYSATDVNYSEYRPMTYLYYKLIDLAKNNGYRKLSWGISTEKQGTILNEGLLTFKESFGSKYVLNMGFYKVFQTENLQFEKYNKKDGDIMIHPLADVQSSEIGNGTRIWQFCVILDGARIGENCNICMNVFIEDDVIIGNNVVVKCGVQLWNGLRLEDDVFIGPNVTFTNDLVPRTGQHPISVLETVLKRGASIGANSVVVAGHTVGEYSLVGAGSVVTKDIPPYTVWYGNPAKQKGYITKSGILLDNTLCDDTGKKRSLED